MINSPILDIIISLIGDFGKVSYGAFSIIRKFQIVESKNLKNYIKWMQKTL